MKRSAWQKCQLGVVGNLGKTRMTFLRPIHTVHPRQCQGQINKTSYFTKRLLLRGCIPKTSLFQPHFGLLYMKSYQFISIISVDFLNSCRTSNLPVLTTPHRMLHPLTRSIDLSLTISVIIVACGETLLLLYQQVFIYS